jgi:hypothetical protein
MWEVELTPQAERWYMGLSAKDADRIAASFDQLELHGPKLRRPVVGLIEGSRHHNMKEVRSFGGHLRALFAFDPRRHAVVLLGGDKAGNWKGWYERNIPRADELYDKHLRAFGKEPPSPPTRPRPGARSEDRGL